MRSTWSSPSYGPGGTFGTHDQGTIEFSPCRQNSPLPPRHCIEEVSDREGCQTYLVGNRLHSNRLSPCLRMRLSIEGNRVYSTNRCAFTSRFSRV